VAAVVRLHAGFHLFLVVLVVGRGAPDGRRIQDRREQLHRGKRQRLSGACVIARNCHGRVAGERGDHIEHGVAALQVPGANQRVSDGIDLVALDATRPVIVVMT
jgi:hypothetical protein